MNNVINVSTYFQLKRDKTVIEKLRKEDEYPFIEKRARDFETVMKESLQVFFRGLSENYDIRTMQEEELQLLLFEKARDASSLEERNKIMKTMSFVFPTYFSDVVKAIFEGHYVDDKSFIPEILRFDSYKDSVDSSIEHLRDLLRIRKRVGNAEYIALVNNYSMYANAALDHNLFGDPWE